MKPSITMRTAFAVAAALVTAPAWGQSLDTGNTGWIAICTALVLFMTIPGLSLFYAGLVRVNNVLSTLVQCLAIACVVSILWLVAGYSLTFGDTFHNVVGDTSRFFYRGVDEASMIGTVPETVVALFQLTFAIISTALVVGAFVERMRFSAVLLFAAAWSLLVYAPVAHWVWGGGWLGEMGLLDYAGGTVVHVTAGTAALVTALVLGPRQGFPETTPPPHSLVFTVVGAMMLWVGWFGFNGGSALAANGDATMSITASHMAAAAGALTWMLVERIREGKPTAMGAAIGVIAGLAAVTPASGFVGPVGGLVMGAVGGVCCYAATGFIKRVLKVDDSLDVFPVHAVGGGLGTLLVAVFGSSSLGPFAGELELDILNQLGKQALGVVAVAAYTMFVTWAILKVVNSLVGIRVSKADEALGLDLVIHEERGYVLSEAPAQPPGAPEAQTAGPPQSPPGG